ncbi:MAG: hypothetical protein WCU88_08025 [Elusimicrobiota bacterium]|jgi:hypothetical protein
MSPEINPARGNKLDAPALALELLLIFLILFIPLQSCLDAAKFTIFAARDLDRAQLLAAGRIILFGPEASGGGHLPGSFYYFLLAAPLKLGFGWKAAWQLQFALMAAGFSLLWLFIRIRLGALPAYYALFCAAFFNYKSLFFAYNASFLPFFTLAALISLCAAFDDRSRRRDLAWALFGLLCGLGLQFHMSFSLILLSGLILQLYSARFGLKPLAWKTFAAGLSAFLLTLLPYGIWLASVRLSMPIGQSALPFTGADAVKLKGIWNYAVKARADYPAQALAQRSLTLLPFEAVIPLIFLSLTACGKNPPLPDKVHAEASPDVPDSLRFAGNCVKVLSVSTALTALTYVMSLALSPTRYSIISRLSLDFLTCALLARRKDRIRPDIFYPALIAGLFALTLAWRICLWPSAHTTLDWHSLLFPAAAGLALALLVLLKTGAKTDRALFCIALALPLILSFIIRTGIKHYSDGDFPKSRDLEEMSRVILSQTGWDYAEARRRIFYINVREMTTVSYLYRAAQDAGRSQASAGSGLDRVDGYFAAIFPRRERDRRNDDNKRWLLRQDLPPILKEGIASGGIVLGIMTNCGGLFLTPYKIADTQQFPPYFHNSSDAYSLTGPEPALLPEPHAKTFRFTFNDCPDHAKWCEILADVQLRRRKDARMSARVVFSGEPLSQACEGVNLQWNELLKRPYLTVECAGSRRRVLLAESLGMQRDKARSMNHSLLAPYERIFNVECRGRLQKISVGYESAAAYHMTRRIEGLPGQEQSAKGNDDASF